MCVNFKKLNKITVFDFGEPMMSPDDIFPKLSGSQIYSTFDFSKGYWEYYTTLYIYMMSKKYTLSDNMCYLTVYISAIVALTVMCADRMYMQS